jgi:hypothetical protein
MSKDRYAFNSVAFSEPLCLCCGFSSLDLATLRNDLRMRSKGKVTSIVNLDCVCIPLDARVGTTIQRHIVRSIPRLPRDTKADDFAHTTRRDAIVSFHLHEHRDGRYVAKDEYQISTESRYLARKNIESANASSKPQQLLGEWPKE